MFLDPYTCTAAQLAWVLAGVIWFFKRHDELPLVVASLVCYVFSFRYWGMAWGWAPGADLAPFGFEQIGYENATSALNLAVLGETTLLAAYMVTQRKNLLAAIPSLPPATATALVRFVFILSAIIIPVSLGTRVFVGLQAEAGKSIGFEVNNYLVLFPFALIGAAILIIAAWKSGAFKTASDKFWAGVALCSIAFVSYSPTGRFQFLGWLVGGVIIITANMTARRRVKIFVCGAVAAIALFAAAGALRDEDVEANEFGQATWERFLLASDVNMLDGLVILQQVYPAMLDFRYGMEHLEILARPIPRSLWPDKPVGGYMNKLGLIDKNSGFTLGISQSLFGSFYEEGSIIGIILLSLVYGYLIARLMMRTTRIRPFAGLLLRGCICAALIPLLRGGDLPGIYAWFGMAFWPCVLGARVVRRTSFRQTSRPEPRTTIGASTIRL